MARQVAIVEDDLDLLVFLQQYLEAEGFDVAPAPRPEQVMQKLPGTSPSLFLVDLVLPGQSGIDLAEQLRRSGHDRTPILAMSASHEQLVRAERSRLFDQTVEKPFDVPRLVDTIRRYVESSIT